MPPEGCRAGAYWAYWVDSMPCFSLQIDDIGPFAGIGRTRTYADLCHISTGLEQELACKRVHPAAATKG